MNKSPWKKEMFVGEFNLMAIRVLEESLINPFLYPRILIMGESGFGKSKLLNSFIKTFQSADSSQISYYTADTFFTEMIFSIKGNRMIDFREKISESNILIIDDIENLRNKTATMEMLLKVLKLREDVGRLTIFSSSVPVKEICGINTSLRNRFLQAVDVKVQKPNKKEAEGCLNWLIKSYELECREDVINYLASLKFKSIGEIEKRVKQIKFYADMLEVEVNLEMVKKVLKLLEWPA